MRIIFVRHGEPDYANDCLTPEGHKQAAAAAERLSVEGVREIYAAPSGRAQQTAACTARRLGLEVATLSFMGEISWGGQGIPADGRPWTLGYRMLQEGSDLNASTGGATPISPKILSLGITAQSLTNSTSFCAKKATGMRAADSSAGEAGTRPWPCSATAARRAS